MSRRWFLCLLIIACQATVVSAAGQTPMATPAPAVERSYENTCDGAQAWFDDMYDVYNEWDASDDPATPGWDPLLLFLDYFRHSNPPPILKTWIDAQIAFWAALSDYGPEMDFWSLLDAIDDAEEDLADLCEDHDFTENF